MAPTLPSSLSPHICILSTPDVQAVFEFAGLPPLPQVLQSFTPLPQVTTRTTTLTNVPHSSFALRFSDLTDIEAATHEDDEQRAGRTMDWMGARISTRCAKWVEMMENQAAAGGMENMWKDRTPWWEEVKKCVEGDHVPNSVEGWNHPVSIILAVSTTAVNPLQALQDLNVRPIGLPTWVDITHLRYYLIIHPSNSPLSDPIAESLFNAVKKQYGHNCYLLPLALPTDPFPAPIPIAPLPPRLPPIPSPNFDTPPLAPRPTPAGLSAPDTPRPIMSPIPRSPGPSTLSVNQEHVIPASTPAGAHTLRLTEGDIQRTAQFVREFVVQCLVPWMEKCVVDWNEQFSSSRRLPSRLFSSTRRLFGSSASSTTPTPVHTSNPSTSSISSRFTSHAPNSSISSIASVSSVGTVSGGLITQQRRLAEFATMLGDYKLAISVWESLRKEGKGGSDILPLLLSPSPALSLHAAHALSALFSQSQIQSSLEAPAHAALRALVYAVRWEIGIDKRDFLGPILDGERWLVQAAGGAEEPPTALLLAHAAFLSERKGARRRSALWYFFAADRLEKIGIKPLAMYFFRRAHKLYKDPSDKEFSPSFWESEGKDPTDWRGFEAVLPGIEHELGRLLYTTGDTGGAVRLFLGLLRWSSSSRDCSQVFEKLANGNIQPEGRQISTDKVYLEDFRVAFKHFKTTEPDKCEAAGLILPVTFCRMKQTRVRFPGDAVEGDSAEWEQLEKDWHTFWASQGQERLEKSGKAAVDETFWVDLVMQNPLNVEVTFSGLTVTVREAFSDDMNHVKDFIEVEVLDDIVLGAKDTRTIPVSVKCKRPASLVITHVSYDFLSLLRVTESLAVRGRRLHDTLHQRQNKTYAPDVLMRVEVEEAGQRLHVNFVDDRHLVLAQGEYKRIQMWLTNSGTRPISELWMLAGEDNEIWPDIGKANNCDMLSSSSSTTTEVLHSTNSMAPRMPYRISLEQLQNSSSLACGDSVKVSAWLHASHAVEQDLCVLFVFREAPELPFHSARVTRHYEVKPILKVVASSRPSGSPDHTFLLNVEVENATEISNVQLTQITTMSPLWACSPLGQCCIGTIPPHQITRLPLGVTAWKDSSGFEATKQFVARKLRDVLQGNQPDTSDPPSIDLVCGHISERDSIRSVRTPAICHFIHSGRRNHSVRSAILSHPYIPVDTHRFIFPLYNPYSVDILVFWELPAQGRSGHVLVPGISLGAEHASLKKIIEEAASAKLKRSMYAETQRERMEVLRGIAESEWNSEMDPIVVTVQDRCLIEHDFRKGPCRASVTFTLRNYSSTKPARVVFKLKSNAANHISPSELLPPHYVGRLTHRSILGPTETVTFRVELLSTRPGSYAIDGWTLNTEVGEAMPVESTGRTSAVASKTAAGWQSAGLCYVQGPSAADRHCITVLDIAQP
ncbi:hypothetical protein AcV5_004630 [Taiwanofungus camphoratus]|nr:hypothetical protein AcW2_000768 [Antrodia cinnamomea]KAI0936513.1 hypothetical protein AcV5_004630 [Antrodia cinnamomea]KAI0961728.1 hypothetical protein AcV7_000750 [Antrodia cinnamomea]